MSTTAKQGSNILEPAYVFLFNDLLLITRKLDPLSSTYAGLFQGAVEGLYNTVYQYQVLFSLSLSLSTPASRPVLSFGSLSLSHLP